MHENREKETWEKPQVTQLLVNEETENGPNEGSDDLERSS